MFLRGCVGCVRSGGMICWTPDYELGGVVQRIYAAGNSRESAALSWLATGSPASRPRVRQVAKQIRWSRRDLSKWQNGYDVEKELARQIACAVAAADPVVCKCSAEPSGRCHAALTLRDGWMCPTRISWQSKRDSFLAELLGPKVLRKPALLELLVSFVKAVPAAPDPAGIFYKSFSQLDADQQAAATALGWDPQTWPDGEASLRWNSVTTWESIGESDKRSWVALGFDARRWGDWGDW